MSDMDLRDISLDLEAATGADSIPTVERIYRRVGLVDGSGPSAYECPYPDCTVVRRAPEAMWRHVHFSRKHGLSFGVETAIEAWRKHCDPAERERLRAALDRVRAAVADHRTSQGPAATVPVWALERAIDGGEG